MYRPLTFPVTHQIKMLTIIEIARKGIILTKTTVKIQFYASMKNFIVVATKEI